MGNTGNNEKRDLFLKTLENRKENLKKRIYEIITETGFEKFTSNNLEYIVKDLREIELLIDFTKSEDFEILTR